MTLAAGNDLTLNAGKDTYTENDSTQTTHTGLMSGGGFSVLIGERSTQVGTTVNDVSYTGSLVGSTGGAVTLTAGHDVHITGSDVLSKTATTIVGQNVTIDAAVGSTDTTQTQEMHSAGISVGLSGGLATVAQSVYGAAQSASHSSDSRVKALYAMQAAQDLFSPGAGHAMGLGGGETGYQALANAPSTIAHSGSATQAAQNTGVSLHVGIGGGSSHSTASTHDDTAYGSQISSAGNVTIAATNGDLNIIGSQVNGKDVTLAASHDLNLLSQAEQHTDCSSSHNASGEVGVSIGETTGIYLSVAAGEALAHGNGTTHDDTVVNAANDLTLISGNDTTIKGGQAQGNSVLANIGGNLDIESEQDTDDYSSHSLQAGLTLVYGFGGSGVGVSGSLAASKANSQYASVTQMSGIGAGSGGFDIHVHGNTNLVGAVIASTASADKNLLDTGSLTYSNLQNEAKSNAESISIGGGYGTGQFAGMKGVSGSIGIPQNGDQRSTTQAGIANGTIVVGGSTNPNLAGLDRNPSLAHANGVTNGFDPQKVAENQQVGQLAGQVGMTAAGDLANTMATDDAKNGDAAGAKSWMPGGTNEVLVHTLVGGAAAALGGGNAAQGALGAGVSEAVTPYLEKYGNTGVLAGTTLVGAMVGGGAGASTALAGTQYNYLSHPQLVELQKSIDTICSGKVNSSCGQSLVDTALIVSGLQEDKLVEECGGKDPKACAADLPTAQAYPGDSLASGLGLQADQQDTSNDLSNILGFHATPQSGLQEWYDAVQNAAANGNVTAFAGAGLLDSVGNAWAGGEAFLSHLDGNNWIGTNPFTGQQYMGVSAQDQFLDAGGQVALAYLTAGASTETEATANEFAAANAAARQSYIPISEFNPLGVQVTPEVMQSPQAQALLQQYLSADVPSELADSIVSEVISTGTELPEQYLVNSDTVLVKLVPRNASGSDVIGDKSPFFVTMQEYDAMQDMSSAQIANYLGLPAEQGVRGTAYGFDAFAMTPKPGTSPVVFSSDVAPVEQGTYTASGGAQQILVPNRSLWTNPMDNKIGSIGGSH